MKTSHKWGVVAVVLIGPALALMDETVVTVILSQMQRAFQTDFATITWTVNAYFLALAAVIPVAGYLSDRIGSKRVFLAALTLFTASSALCALSPTKEVLFTSRVLQGIGGGALIPLALAIIYRTFPPSERGLVSGVAGIPLFAAPALGPTVAGYLSTSFNWNAVFILNVPFGIVALLSCFLILPGRESELNGQAQGAIERFDIVGLLLSLVGVTALVYGIIESSSKGWSEATVLTSLLIGVAVLVAFIVVELRVSDPVLDLRLFTNYTFTISNLLTYLTVGMYVGSLFLLPLFFENVRGDTALSTGSFLIGQGLALGVGMSISGMLYNRLGPRILTVFGLLLTVGGTYGLTQIDVNTTGQALQIWLILRGLGLGFASQPLNATALSTVSNKAMAMASSLMNVTRQMATTIIVAVLATYLTLRTATHGVGAQALTAGLTDTFWIVLILCGIGIPLALVMGHDPAVGALKQAKRVKAPGEVVQIAGVPKVISTLAANGEQTMGPEILLWHSPENHVVNGSVLRVDKNHFCVLKSHGVVLNVYEAGQYILQPPDLPHFDSIQLTFSGEPIPWQYEVLYINRAKLLVRASGVALSREMAEVNYSVDYYIHVATREDAIQLVEHMPYLGHTLTIREMSAYAEPIIEEAMNQLMLITPLREAQGLKMIQDLTQLVYQYLQPFLSTYGVTLDMVKVQGLSPRDERMKGLITLKAFGLSELDAVRHFITMQKNVSEHRINGQYEELEQKLYMIWRKTLDRYTNEIIALQAELENTRATIGLHMDAHNTRLQELSQAISSDLRTSASILNISEASPLAAALPESGIAGSTGQFRTIDRGTTKVKRHYTSHSSNN
jgi:EmrB/QacA subfamily drug resistance transporter